MLEQLLNFETPSYSMREYNSNVQYTDLSFFPRNATHRFFFFPDTDNYKPRQKVKYFKASFIYLVLCVKDFYKL